MNDDGYMDLLAAVYKNAVVDDVKEIKKLAKPQLDEIYRPEGTPRYVKCAPKMLTRYKANAAKYLKSKEEYIQAEVRGNIARESVEWGSGKTRKMQADGIAVVVDKVVKMCKEENHDRKG